MQSKPHSSIGALKVSTKGKRKRHTSIWLVHTLRLWAECCRCIAAQQHNGMIYIYVLPRISMQNNSKCITGHFGPESMAKERRAKQDPLQPRRFVPQLGW